LDYKLGYKAKKLVIFCIFYISYRMKHSTRGDEDEKSNSSLLGQAVGIVV